MSSADIRTAAACRVCKQVNRSNLAIFMCKSGHNICQTCKLVTKKCPVARCKYAKTPPRNEALEKLVREHVKFECKFRRHGCNKDLILSLLPQHEFNCDWRTVECTNQCQRTIVFKMLCKHLDEECPQRAVVCPEAGCRERVKAEELQQHQAQCDFRIVACPEPGCDQRKAANDMHAHRATCNFRIDTCPEDGCKERVVVHILHAHRANCRFRLVSCPENGCDTKISFHTLEEHRKICSFRIVTCPEAGCNQQIAAGKLFFHISGCRFRLVGCPEVGCNEWAPMHSIQQHKVACAFRLEACPEKGCFKNVAFQELERHRMECNFRMVTCPETGCDLRLSAFYLKTHRASCTFRMVSCPEIDCKEKLRADSLQNHMFSCQFRMVPCPEEECSEIVAARALFHHRSNCKFRIIVCKECELAIKADRHSHHKVNDCWARLVPCQWSRCHFRVKLNSMSSHLQGHKYIWGSREENDGKWGFKTSTPAWAQDISTPNRYWNHFIRAVEINCTVHMIHVLHEEGYCYVWTAAEGNSEGKRCKIVLRGNDNKMTVSSIVFQFDQLRHDILNSEVCIKLNQKELEAFFEVGSDDRLQLDVSCIME